MTDWRDKAREAGTEVKEKARELDGHQITDDIGNAGDEAREKLEDLGDDLERGRDSLEDRSRPIDDATADERAERPIDRPR